MGRHSRGLTRIETSLSFSVREPEVQESKEGETDEEAVLLSFSQLVSTRRTRFHFSRSHG